MTSAPSVSAARLPQRLDPRLDLRRFRRRRHERRVGVALTPVEIERIEYGVALGRRGRHQFQLAADVPLVESFGEKDDGLASFDGAVLVDDVGEPQQRVARVGVGVRHDVARVLLDHAARADRPPTAW